MLNEGKVAEMDRLHGDLVRVIHDANPDASVSIVLYGEKVLEVLNMVSLDNGHIWDFVGPFLSKNNEDKTFLRVSLGVSSFKVLFSFNAL